MLGKPRRQAKCLTGIMLRVLLSGAFGIYSVAASATSIDYFYCEEARSYGLNASIEFTRTKGEKDIYLYHFTNVNIWHRAHGAGEPRRKISYVEIYWMNPSIDTFSERIGDILDSIAPDHVYRLMGEVENFDKKENVPKGQKVCISEHVIRDSNHFIYIAADPALVVTCELWHSAYISSPMSDCDRYLDESPPTR